MEIIVTEVKLNGQVIRTIPLMKKEFSTGSKGFHGFGKVGINGKRYQVNFMLVEIGSRQSKNG